MREIDISDQLLPRHHEVMRCLRLLAQQVDTSQWCLVGGLMVLVVARDAGRTNARAEGTKDGDIVVDVAAEPNILANVAYTLRSLGYDYPENTHPTDILHSEVPLRDAFARCTFVSGNAQLDVLAPDDAPLDRLDVGTELRTISIPGGRRALTGSELTSIYYAHDAADVVIRVPSLTGAICVKAAAAVDLRTAAQPRHGQDVAFMLTCIDDPIAAADELDHNDRTLLAEFRQQLGSGDGAPWRFLINEEQARAMAALDFLVAD
ncbi:MAG: hypothetical protein WCK14_13495 [Actinomycetota bacterium]